MRLLIAGGLFALPVTYALSGLLSDASQVNGQSFDYVIVGGGLAGLVVANRLSEDPDITVLVIEAGGDSRTDDRVAVATNYGQAFGSDLDWGWKTSNGKSLIGGKTLGGSTAVNGMTYTRGEAAQYDALGTLLGTDTTDKWSWQGMFAGMTKAEHFTAPTSDQTSLGASYEGQYHGSSGPLQVGYPDGMYKGPQQADFYTVASRNFSVATSTDADGGKAANVAYHPNTLKGNTRSSSATAYWSSIEGERPNIAVLVSQMATKIVTTGANGTVTATGVEFGAQGGDSYSVNASREVIVSAGAIQSPVLLQLSGIGDSNVLTPLGIDVVVDLPGVGKNLQDQTMGMITWNAASGFNADGTGPNNVIAYPDLATLFGDDLESIKSTISSNIDAYAADAAANGGMVNASAASAIFAIQQDLMVNLGVGVAELFFSNSDTSIGINVWNMLPFSRGSVNISSTNPYDNPFIDPRYLSADVDMQVMVKGCRMVRKIFGTDPLRSLVSDETAPGGAVPSGEDGGSDAEWRQWISDNFLFVNHQIGTCAMMKAEYGGVVDASLVVYGTTNIRVVDGSVLPMQMSAHLSATLYGLAENAADIIKAGRQAVEGGTATTQSPHTAGAAATDDPTTTISTDNETPIETLAAAGDDGASSNAAGPTKSCSPRSRKRALRWT